MKFRGQRVLIAGGTSGIGLATARCFRKEGAHVTVTGMNPERLAAAQEEGLNAQALDSRDRKALDKFFANHGPFDHLIIGLGGSKGMGEFSGMSLDTLKEGFEEKFWAQLETLQAALPHLTKGASITVITAGSARMKAPGISGLAAINGAMELMVPGLSKELASFRLNAVSPGVVDTPWWDFLPAGNKRDMFAQFTADIPSHRPAQPEEVADVIEFLAGNSYMTGKVVGVDGGLA
ncbi:MAG: SDR family oxidoreductase [Bacteroidota bacterium]|nr:SDR family oxidoreductase [Bacteroidota bacterium]MDP4215314.1 SDR family oxidoreductase [Bacteroidota bacterium]MDP4247203.1 SDR family oxidoreductase [Bacteroidota bacterium]MDP4252877.1 SDR family oxidoreductase [Bacteroidota bacterium]MDP4259134.1 SDR family oxidoreductase [Bacteroidota bacterium]